MLKLLENPDEVIWIDSDIIITKPIRHPFLNIMPQTFVATEEPVRAWQGRGATQMAGSPPRTGAWGLAPGARPVTRAPGRRRGSGHIAGAHEYGNGI